MYFSIKHVGNKCHPVGKSIEGNKHRIHQQETIISGDNMLFW